MLLPDTTRVPSSGYATLGCKACFVCTPRHISSHQGSVADNLSVLIGSASLRLIGCGAVTAFSEPNLRRYRQDWDRGSRQREQACLSYTGRACAAGCRQCYYSVDIVRVETLSTIRWQQPISCLFICRVLPSDASSSGRSMSKPGIHRPTARRRARVLPTKKH